MAELEHSPAIDALKTQTASAELQAQRAQQLDRCDKGLEQSRAELREAMARSSGSQPDPVDLSRDSREEDIPQGESAIVDPGAEDSAHGLGRDANNYEAPEVSNDQSPTRGEANDPEVRTDAERTEEASASSSEEATQFSQNRESAEQQAAAEQNTEQRTSEPKQQPAQSGVEQSNDLTEDKKTQPILDGAASEQSAIKDASQDGTSDVTRMSEQQLDKATGPEPPSADNEQQRTSSKGKTEAEKIPDPFRMEKADDASSAERSQSQDNLNETESKQSARKSERDASEATPRDRANQNQRPVSIERDTDRSRYGIRHVEFERVGVPDKGKQRESQIEGLLKAAEGRGFKLERSQARYLEGKLIEEGSTPRGSSIPDYQATYDKRTFFIELKAYQRLIDEGPAVRSKGINKLARDVASQLPSREKNLREPAGPGSIQQVIVDISGRQYDKQTAADVARQIRAAIVSHSDHQLTDHDIWIFDGGPSRGLTVTEARSREQSYLRAQSLLSEMGKQDSLDPLRLDAAKSLMDEIQADRAAYQLGDQSQSSAAELRDMREAALGGLDLLRKKAGTEIQKSNDAQAKREPMSEAMRAIDAIADRLRQQLSDPGALELRASRRLGLDPSVTIDQLASDITRLRGELQSNERQTTESLHKTGEDHAGRARLRAEKKRFEAQLNCLGNLREMLKQDIREQVTETVKLAAAQVQQVLPPMPQASMEAVENASRRERAARRKAQDELTMRGRLLQLWVEVTGGR